MPGENVPAHTARLDLPGTRRPYGVLEWPAMLRLFAADENKSGYAPYWQETDGRAGDDLGLP